MKMIEQLKSILSTEGEEFSALLQILSKYERIKHESDFDFKINIAKDKEDIQIKFFALNALFIYIKNNPDIEENLNQEEDISTEHLAEKIYELAIILYKNDCTWENYFYVVAYATLANKSTLLSREQKPEKENNFFESLLHFFINFSFPPRTKEGLKQRTDALIQLKEKFKKIQLPENISNHTQLYDIVALSNLVSLGEKLQEYLLDGTGSNISTIINDQLANAIKIFTDIRNRQWELICSLLRFVLQKYYENTVWTIANRVTAPKCV